MSTWHKYKFILNILSWNLILIYNNIVVLISIFFSHYVYIMYIVHYMKKLRTIILHILILMHYFMVRLSVKNIFLNCVSAYRGEHLLRHLPIFLVRKLRSLLEPVTPIHPVTGTAIVRSRRKSRISSHGRQWTCARSVYAEIVRESYVFRSSINHCVRTECT